MVLDAPGQERQAAVALRDAAPWAQPNRLIVMHGRDVTHAPLEAAAGKQRTVPLDHPLLATALAVGTSFGV